MNITTHSDELIITRTKKWLEHAVIGLNLCPFAKAVYVKNQVRFVVSHAQTLDHFLELLDAELALLAQTPSETIDTTLIMDHTLFNEFSIFNDMLEIAEKAPQDLDLSGEIQVASFHPNFQFEHTQPDDPENRTNQAPYPTLHLIRESSISRAVKNHEDAAKIYQRNIDLMNTMNEETWQVLSAQWNGK